MIGLEIKQLTKRERRALLKSKEAAGSVKALLKVLPVGRSTYYSAIDPNETLRLESLNAIRAFLNNQKQSA